MISKFSQWSRVVAPQTPHPPPTHSRAPRSRFTILLTMLNLWRNHNHSLFFRRFLLGLTTFSILGEDWALGNNSIKFWDFPDISFLFLFFYFVKFFFRFPYVHEIQYNQNMKTHTCLLLSTMPNYMHTNMKTIYTSANTGVMVICMHTYIRVPPSFPPPRGSYKVDFFLFVSN